MRKTRAVLVAVAVAVSCSAPSEKPPAFADAAPAVTVPQGYAEEATLDVVAGTARSFVFLRPEQPVDELVVGFVGSGSEDDPAELAPKGRLTVRLSVTSPDATKAAHQVPVGLYTLASATADLSTAKRVATATVALTVRFPVVSLSVLKVREDPSTLAQTWRVTNGGDDVSDLVIEGKGASASLVDLRPTMDHVFLARGESMDFDVVPQLFPGMRALAAELQVTAGNAPPIPVSLGFAAPSGKDVYVGFGGSVGPRRCGGSYCTNQGRVLQEFGKGPRKADKNQTPDFWSKQGMGNLYRNGTNDGMAAGKALSKATGSKHLNVPMAMLGWLFGKVADLISRDPPDPNFQLIARPTFRTAPRYAPDAAVGLTQAGADALSAVAANGFLLNDIGLAAAATLDKLEGARLAGDQAWARKHAIAYRTYAAMLADRARVHAQLLRALEAVAPAAWTRAPTQQEVEDAQADLAANGFTADELADFASAGLTQAEVDALKAGILAADPARAAQVTLATLADSLWVPEGSPPADLGRVFELAATADAASAVGSAAVLVRFELEGTRCPIGPHTTEVSFNGAVLATLTDKVPEGLYGFAVDPAAVRFYGAEAEWNELELESLDINTGSFVRALDTVLLVSDSVHGVLVVAADQAEADALAGAVATRNHARPDVALLANELPHLERRQLQDGEVVQLPLTVRNFGAAASGALTVAAYAADPRLGPAGPPVAGPLAVAALQPWASASVSLPVAGRLLKGTGGGGAVFVAVTDASGNDFDAGNDAFALAPEQPCD